MPIAIALVITRKDGLRPMPMVNMVIDTVVNILRSVPFLILMILVTPLMRLIAGKGYGPTATIVALVVAAAPYVARMIESSLLEVDPGVIEAALSMGASTKTIIFNGEDFKGCSNLKYINIEELTELITIGNQSFAH